MGTGCSCAGSSPQDPFSGLPAVLHAFVPAPDSSQRSLRYTVGGTGCGLSLYASGEGVDCLCPAPGRESMVLRGTGRFQTFRRGCAEAAGSARYVLSVQPAGADRLSFRMRISSPEEPCVQYDSGVLTLNPSSDLFMSAC